MKNKIVLEFLINLIYAHDLAHRILNFPHIHDCNRRLAHCIRSIYVMMHMYIFKYTSKVWRKILLLYPRLIGKQYPTHSSYILHVFIGMHACVCVCVLVYIINAQWWRIFIENGFACEMRINERNWKMTKDIIWHVYVKRLYFSIDLVCAYDRNKSPPLVWHSHCLNIYLDFIWVYNTDVVVGSTLTATSSMVKFIELYTIES